MSDTPPEEVVTIWYKDLEDVTQSITVPLNQANTVHSGVTIYTTPMGTDPVFFAPWSRILLIGNVNGGGMPLIP